MTDSHSPPKTLFNGRLGRAIMALGSFIAAIFIAVIASHLFEKQSARSEIEYDVTKVEKLYSHVQDLDRHVALQFDGKPVDNIGCIEIDIFNRTAKNFQNLPIILRLRDSKAHVTHKLLIYNNDAEKDWYGWKASGDNDDLTVLAKVLNISWERHQNFRIRLFFASGPLPEVELTTDQAGVYFVPYNKDAYFWWLFGYDVPVFFCAFLVVVFGFMIWLIRASTRHERKRNEAFIRIFGNALNEYWKANERASVGQMTRMAFDTYRQISKRVRLSAKWDRPIQIPKFEAEEKSTNPTPPVPGTNAKPN